MKKIALITGASRGIGKATAIKFLKEGYIVYGTYNKSYNEMLEIQKKYGKDNFIICGPYDFTKIEEIEALVNSIVDIEFDTLVLNAGIFSDNDDFINFDYNEFSQVMNCNFYAPLIISTKLQSYIKNGGNIVIMSSNDAYSGAFGSMSYSISKSSVISLMKCLCVNFGRRGIRVNSVAPGAINTDMNTVEQEFEAPAWTPLERIAQPYEVADIIYFLSTPQSGFINGENITIDGGYSQTSILLKKEIERNRKIIGYDYINNMLLNLKKGDKVYCFDTTPDYGWIDHPKEIEYIQNNITAMLKGVQVYRIISISKKRFDEIINNPLIKHAIENTTNNSKTILVKSEDVKTCCKDEYLSFGKGLLIIEHSDGNKELMIDSFSNENNIGYLLNDMPIIAEQLKEKFLNVLKKIESGKIEEVQLSNDKRKKSVRGIINGIFNSKTVSRKMGDNRKKNN